MSVVPYLTDKGQLTVLYEINNNVDIKTSKTVKDIVIILYSSQNTHMQTPTLTHTLHEGGMEGGLKPFVPFLTQPLAHTR